VRDPSRLRRALGYAAYLLGVGLIGGYALFLGYRSLELYRYLKTEHLGFRGHVHRSDPELGFAALPGASGFHGFPDGSRFAMRYDDEGFRVPAGRAVDTSRPRPWVLSLGCSFTYGDSCPAEDTYSYHVAQGLSGSALNAGKCAYGLAQMLILARRLIPRYKPDYVLVQFSPWLAGRGTSGFARSAFGAVPVPFLLLRENGSLEVHPPVFSARVFDLPFDQFYNARSGVVDFLRFFFMAGAPLAIHDDFAMARYRLDLRLGRLPESDRERAAGDEEGLNQKVYGEIGSLCRANGATMVVVRLSYPLERTWQGLRRLSPGAIVINAQRALDAQVPEGNREAYYRRFGHWRGSPPVLVDTHPNPAAHRIIADQILAVLGGGPAASRR
jgi:hypothetical protein